MFLLRVSVGLLFFNCSVAVFAIWDQALNRSVVFGCNVGVHHATGTIQSGPDVTDGIFNSVRPKDTSAAFADPHIQSPAKPFFSTYDDWSLNAEIGFTPDELNKNFPVIAVKLTQAEINKLPVALLHYILPSIGVAGDNPALGAAAGLVAALEAALPAAPVGELTVADSAALAAALAAAPSLPAAPPFVLARTAVNKFEADRLGGAHAHDLKATLAIGDAVALDAALASARNAKDACNSVTLKSTLTTTIAAVDAAKDAPGDAAKVTAADKAIDKFEAARVAAAAALLAPTLASARDAVGAFKDELAAATAFKLSLAAGDAAALAAARGAIDFFICIQGLPEVKNAIGYKNVLLQPHTWAHEYVPAVGAFSSAVDLHLSKKRNVEGNDFKETAMSLPADGVCTSHDKKLSGNCRHVVELRHGAGFNRDDPRRIYISTAKVLSYPTPPVGAQQSGRTAVTLHLLLNDAEYMAISRIFQDLAHHAAETDTLNHILAAPIFADYPGFNEFRTLLINLRDTAVGHGANLNFFDQAGDPLVVP
jgi:hypothetical protein